MVSDCVWMDLNVYVVSDKTGHTAVLHLGGVRPKVDISDESWNELVERACVTLNSETGEDDARAMTMDEVKAYRADDKPKSKELN